MTETTEVGHFFTQSDTVRQIVKKMNEKRERAHDLSGVHYQPDQECRMAAWALEGLLAERKVLRDAMKRSSMPTPCSLLAPTGRGEGMFCGDCKFWVDATGGERKQGVCHRHPPPGGDTNFNSSGRPRWPMTQGGDWCGEWSPAPGTAPDVREAEVIEVVIQEAVCMADDNDEKRYVERRLRKAAALATQEGRDE